MSDHPTKPHHSRHDWIKFLMLLGIFAGYFGYLSWEYDLKTGGIVAAITWSFFVLCTPIADAGFLLDFPVRMITGIKMFFIEFIVWVLALGINMIALTYAPAAYETNLLTSTFHTLLTTPWPYWSIIILCAAGTFLSIHLGDDIMDALSNHKDTNTVTHFKKKIAVMACLIIAIIVIYYDLIKTLNIEMPN